jgi:hypothetical protein
LAEQKQEPGAVTNGGNADGPAAAQADAAEPAVTVPAARMPASAPPGSAPPGSAPPDTALPDSGTPDSGTAAESAAPDSGTVPDSPTDKADKTDKDVELERLRTEVRELRERQPPAGQARRPRRRWKSVLAAVAITLGCVLAPVSVLGVWGANQVSSTDRFVANMAPLISEPPIQQALSAKITAQIISRVDVKALTAQTSAQLTTAHLPRLAALVQQFEGPIANGVNSFIGTVVARAVASPAMAALWVNALRLAHQGVVRVLSGQGNGAVDVVNGQVVINIGPLITQVKDALIARGLSVAAHIPTVNATFPLFAAPNLEKAQSGYRLLQTLRWVLPFLSLVLLAVGIWLARGRRRALIGAALGFAASMLVLAAALAIARGIYLNSVPQSVLPSNAAAALYDTLVRFIKEALRALLVVGLVVAAAAFLVGPATLAVRTRRGVATGIGWLSARGERAGLHTGPVGVWTSAHKTALRVGAVVVAALIFVFWGQVSVALVVWIVVLLLVALGLIELIGGRSGPAAQPAAAAAAEPGP